MAIMLFDLEQVFKSAMAASIILQEQVSLSVDAKFEKRYCYVLCLICLISTLLLAISWRCCTGCSYVNCVQDSQVKHTEQCK